MNYNKLFEKIDLNVWTRWTLGWYINPYRWWNVRRHMKEPCDICGKEPAYCQCLMDDEPEEKEWEKELD